MIAFDQHGDRFNYSIVGVATNGAHVLLHRAETEAFWSLPAFLQHALRALPSTTEHVTHFDHNFAHTSMP